MNDEAGTGDVQARGVEVMIEALMKGAVLLVSDTGDAEAVALDDLAAPVRDCFLASREHDWAHQGRCPDCLEDEAMNILMDADSHRADGNKATALELEAEAEAVRLPGGERVLERVGCRTRGDGGRLWLPPRPCPGRVYKG